MNLGHIRAEILRFHFRSNLLSHLKKFPQILCEYLCLKFAHIRRKLFAFVVNAWIGVRKTLRYLTFKEEKENKKHTKDSITHSTTGWNDISYEMLNNFKLKVGRSGKFPFFSLLEERKGLKRFDKHFRTQFNLIYLHECELLFCCQLGYLLQIGKGSHPWNTLEIINLAHHIFRFFFYELKAPVPDILLQKLDYDGQKFQTFDILLRAATQKKKSYFSRIQLE